MRDLSTAARRPARCGGARHAAFLAVANSPTLRAAARRAQGEAGPALPRLHQPRRARAGAREGLDRRSRGGRRARSPVDVCTYHSPRVRGLKGRVMTNAAKWAYYAPGMLGVEVAFGSLKECVESAIRGEVWRDPDVCGLRHDPAPRMLTAGSGGRPRAVARRALELLGRLRAAHRRDPRRAPPAARRLRDGNDAGDDGDARLRLRTRRHRRSRSGSARRPPRSSWPSPTSTSRSVPRSPRRSTDATA